MPKQRVWISYDLGVQGNYEGLYQWLDEHNAVECGDSVASFEFKFAKDLPKELGTALMSVQLGPRPRIFLIIHAKNGVRAGWLIGRGQRPPWAGYAPTGTPGEATFGWEPPERQ